MQNKNFIITAVIVAVVFGGGGFYGGMLFGKSQSPAASNQARFGQRQNGASQSGTNGAARRSTSGGFVGGKIISKDDKSVTLQSPNGGSLIVFFADSTQVGKAATGTASDLVTGAQVMVNGTTNADGSITAKTIQVR